MTYHCASTPMESQKSERVRTLEREYLAAYEENADALFRHCVARVRDRELAKDIVQETFARTWVYLADGKKIDHLRAFLYRTLHNAIVDAMRKKRSVSLDVLHEEEGYEIVDESHKVSPEDREDIGQAMQLLTSLDHMYATVITMRYIDELSPGEIAQILNVSENVVSVRLHRGVKQLRLLWQDQAKENSI